MGRHTPGAGPPTFGYHDGELVHGVGFESGDGVAESRGVCRLKTRVVQNLNSAESFKEPSLRIQRLQPLETSADVQKVST